MKSLRLDRSCPITAEVIREAKERLVLSRAVHLDQLIDKLQEEVLRAGNKLETVMAQGTEQTRRYMDQCGATHGHLVVFDARGRTSWAKRVYVKPLAADLTLWGY